MPSFYSGYIIDADARIIIRREADGFMLDWTTGEFTETVSADQKGAYDEIDPVIMPGLYKKEVDTSDWDSGTYTAISYLTDPIVNKVEEFEISNGKKVNISDTVAASISIPESSILVQEYYNNKDADGNDMIYGVDFYISTGRPKMLDNLPRRGISMTWTEYLASI